MARQVITDSNLSPLLEIFNWLLLCFTVISVLGRTATKFLVIRRIASDDGLILVALVSSLTILSSTHVDSTKVLSISQSIAVSVEIANGAGQHLAALSLSQVDALQKVCKSFLTLFTLVSDT